eukprot:scaffold225876_cov39-Tisochrysis_lutea.AAC.3
MDQDRFWSAQPRASSRKLLFHLGGGCETNLKCSSFLLRHQRRLAACIPDPHIFHVRCGSEVPTILRCYAIIAPKKTNTILNLHDDVAHHSGLLWSPSILNTLLAASSMAEPAFPTTCSLPYHLHLHAPLRPYSLPTA